MASKPPSNKLKLRVCGDGSKTSGKRRRGSDPQSSNKPKRPTLLSSKSKKSTTESDEESLSDDDDESDEEQGDESSDGDDDSEEVGSAIEEPTMYVHGVGSGKANKCENSTHWPELDDEYDQDFIGEVIEEMTMYVYGDGSGHDCDVGNEDPKATESNATNTTETEPVATKPMFFFGQAGCLKLSPMMKPATPPITSVTSDSESPKKSETLPNEESSTSTPINPDASSKSDLPASSNNHGTDETDKASATNTADTIAATESQPNIDENKSDISLEQRSPDVDDKTPSTNDDNKMSSNTTESNATSIAGNDATAAHENSIDKHIADGSNNVNADGEPLNATESNVEPLSNSEILSDKLESYCSEALENEPVQECGATNEMAITPTTSSLSDSISNATQPDFSDKSDQLTIEETKGADNQVNESVPTENDCIAAENECKASQELVSDNRKEESFSESSSEPVDNVLVVSKDDDQVNATNAVGSTLENGANVPTESQISSESEKSVSVAAETKNDNNEGGEAPSESGATYEKVESVENMEENGPSEIEDCENVEKLSEPAAKIQAEASFSQTVEGNLQVNANAIELEPIMSSTTETNEQQVEPDDLSIPSTCGKKSESSRKDGGERTSSETHVENERGDEVSSASTETPSQLTTGANPITTGKNDDETRIEPSNDNNIIERKKKRDKSSDILVSSYASEVVSEHLPTAQEKLSTSPDALIAAVENSIIVQPCEIPKPEPSKVCKESVLAKAAAVSEKRKSADDIEEPFVCKKVYVCGEDGEHAGSTLTNTIEPKESTSSGTLSEVQKECAVNVATEEPQTKLSLKATDPIKPIVEEVKEDFPEIPSTSHETPSDQADIKQKSGISDRIRRQRDTVPPIKCDAKSVKKPVSKTSTPSTETSATPQLRNRKRRISGPKARLSSESENDIFDPAAESPLSQDANSDDEVGGKRIKMRGRNIQRNARETVEQKRNIKDTDWSSDDNLKPNAKRATNQATDETAAVAHAKVEEPVTVPVKIFQAEDESIKSEVAEAIDDVNDDDSTVKEEVASDDEPLKAPKKAGRPGRRGKKPGPKPKAKPAVKPKQEEPDEPTDEQPPPKETKPDTRRKKRSLMGLDMAEVESVQSAFDSEPQVRQSRRIAQIKIREEADRRKAEEVALYKMKEASEKKKKNLVSKPDSESEENSESEVKLETKKRRKKGNKDQPWLTDSDDDASEHEEDDDDHYHEREERLVRLMSE